MFCLTSRSFVANPEPLHSNGILPPKHLLSVGMMVTHILLSNIVKGVITLWNEDERLTREEKVRFTLLISIDTAQSTHHNYNVQ